MTFVVGLKESHVLLSGAPLCIFSKVAHMTCESRSVRPNPLLCLVVAGVCSGSLLRWRRQRCLSLLLLQGVPCRDAELCFVLQRPHTYLTAPLNLPYNTSGRKGNRVLEVRSSLKVRMNVAATFLSGSANYFDAQLTW